MSHGSARLTVHGRRLIVQRHQAGWKQAHIASAMGVSRKCVKTWIDRYAAEGEAGLLTRSSRPRTMPTRTPEQVEQKVLAARAEHRDTTAAEGHRRPVEDRPPQEKLVDDHRVLVELAQLRACPDDWTTVPTALLRATARTGCSDVAGGFRRNAQSGVAIAPNHQRHPLPEIHGHRVVERRDADVSRRGIRGVARTVGLIGGEVHGLRFAHRPLHAQGGGGRDRLEGLQDRGRRARPVRRR